MEVPRLGSAGIPALGMGTWQLQGMTCVDRVKDALKMGYRHIDTAEMYGNEEAIGRGIRGAEIPREEILLTTKVSPENLSSSQVKRAAEGSLRRLRSEYIDLLLIHWPDEEVPLEETLHAMESLRDQGKARFLGVSNFPTSLWQRALAIAPIVCNQVEYHLFLAQDDLVRMAREREQTLIAYCPLAQGRVLRDPVVQEMPAGSAEPRLSWLSAGSFSKNPLPRYPRRQGGNTRRRICGSSISS